MYFLLSTPEIARVVQEPHVDDRVLSFFLFQGLGIDVTMQNYGSAKRKLMATENEEFNNKG